jgi:hypothetical protein
MNILNKPINDVTYSDIQDLCSEGQIEGVQLEYKRELPAKGLAKHFASFSNTRGGIIIIGVEEDPLTGKPKSYDGVVFETKLIDKIHQYATCVEPRPAYEVSKTDEKNGKLFILIRIFEGDQTPYYVQNDANIYIRTGNITDLIDLASPDAAELLFSKKDKAALARQNYTNRTDEIFKAALKRANIQRLRAIAEKKEIWKQQNPDSKEEFRSEYPMDPLGTNTSMCTILLQPWFPKRAITTPQEIKSKAGNFTINYPYTGTFPNYKLRPIQDGVMSFDWNQNGFIQCEQIYATGLIYDTEDVSRVADNRKNIYIETVASKLFVILFSASKFFQMFGYQGGLKGFLSLENIDGAIIFPIVPNGFHFDPFYFEDMQEPILSKYEWDLDLDTTLLNDPIIRQEYFIEKIREIYWSLGYENVKQEVIEKFLEQYGWLVKDNK